MQPICQPSAREDELIALHGPYGSFKDANQVVGLSKRFGQPSMRLAKVLSLHAFHVLTRTRIDLDHIADIDEGRTMHFRTRF